MIDSSKGKVILIGAGPGDIGLLTLNGKVTSLTQEDITPMMTMIAVSLQAEERKNIGIISQMI